MFRNQKVDSLPRRIASADDLSRRAGIAVGLLLALNELDDLTPAAATAFFPFPAGLGGVGLGEGGNGR